MTKRLLILSLGILPGLFSAQTVLWGVGSANGVANAEFSLPFTNSTTATFDVNNWTAQTISNSTGAVTPGSAYWERSTTGISLGGYSSSLPIASPSQSNGAGLFDSDFMDNGGTVAAFGTGIAPSVQIGDLVSPRIDLTGYTNVGLEIKFYCKWKSFYVNNFLVSLSVNDGVSWTDVDINTLLFNGINSENEGWVLALFPNITQNVSNLTSCRIRFRFDGDYYFALVDDISLQITCPPSSSVINETACNSYTSPSGNFNWTSSNTYTDTIPNTANCDSIITVNLTIINSSTGTDTRTECNSYTWIDGINYTADNNTATYNIAGGAANGCDSLVTLDLTIINSSTGTDTRTECNSYTWIDGINYTADNNTATSNIAGGAANGCDSLVTLDLTIVNSATGTDTRTECNSYTWIDGINYTVSNNTATHNIAGGASNGCDSLVTLDLTIVNSATGIDTRTECNSYIWIDGINYTVSNNTATYNIAGGTASGCDSLVTLDLTINNVSDITTSTSGVTITANNAGAIYQWLDCDDNYALINGVFGQSFTTASNGTYAVQLTENGCVDTTSCVAITSVGIVENSFGNMFTVYPNPTKGNFSIDLGATYGPSVVSITDLSGKLIDSKTITQSQTINLTLEEPTGIYVVSIQSGDKKAVVRLVKE